MKPVSPVERTVFPLKEKYKGHCVRIWQMYLRLKKIKTGKKTQRLLVADGIWGKKTTEATRKFLNGKDTVSKEIYMSAQTHVIDRMGNTRSSALEEQDRWWSAVEECESKYWFSRRIADMAYATVIRLPKGIDPTKPIMPQEDSHGAHPGEEEEEHHDQEKEVSYEPPTVNGGVTTLGKYGHLAERLGIRKILSFYNKTSPAKVPIPGKIENIDQMIENLDVFGAADLDENGIAQAYKDVSVTHYFDNRPNILRPHYFLIEMPERVLEIFEDQEVTYMRPTSITTGTLDEDPDYTPNEGPLRPRDKAATPDQLETLTAHIQPGIGPIRPCDAMGGCHVITFNNSNIGILDKVADILQEYHRPILEFKKNGSVRSIDILAEAKELRKFRKRLNRFLKLRNQGYHKEGFLNGLDETQPFNLEIGLNTAFELSYILFDNGTKTDLGIFSRLLSPCRVGMECFRYQLSPRVLGYVLYSREIIKFWKAHGQKPVKWIDFVSEFTYPPVAIRPSNNKDDEWELCAYKANKYATKPVLSQAEKDERDEIYDNFDLDDEDCKDKIASEREDASESTQDSFFSDAGTFVVDELTGALEDIYEGVIDHIDIRTIIGEVYKCIAYHTGVPATAEAICEAAITWVLKESGVMEFLDTLFAVIPEDLKDGLKEVVETTLLAGETFLGEPVGSSTGQPTIIGGMSIAVSDAGYTAEANMPGTGATSEFAGTPGTDETIPVGTTVYGVVTPVTNQIARDLNQIDNFIQKLKQMFDLRDLCERLVEAGMNFPADFLENPFFTEEGAAKYLEELKNKAPELPKPPTFSTPGGGGAMGSALNGNFYKQIRNSIVRAITESLGELIKTLIYKLLEMCFKEENPNIPAYQNYGNADMEDVFDRAGFGRQPPRQIFENAGIPYDPNTAGMLIQDIADMLTLSELCALLQGNATNQLIANIIDLLRYNYGGHYYRALDTPTKIKKFFADMGSMIDTEICQQVERLIPDLDDACKSISVYEDRCVEMVENGIPLEVCQEQLKEELRSNIASLKSLSLLLMGDNADILNEALKDKLHCGPGGIYPGLPPGIKLSNERAMGTMFRHIKNMFTLELTAIRDRVMGFSSSDTAQATNTVEKSLELEEWVGEIDEEGVLRGLSAATIIRESPGELGFPRFNLWEASPYNAGLEEEDLCLPDNPHPPYPDPCPPTRSCSVRVKNGAWCLTDLLKVNLDHIHSPGNGGFKKHDPTPGYRTYSVNFQTDNEDEPGAVTRVFLPYSGKPGEDTGGQPCDHETKAWDPQHLRDVGCVVSLPKNTASDSFKATPGAFQLMSEMLTDDVNIRLDGQSLYFDVPAAKMPQIPQFSVASIMPAFAGGDATAAETFEQKWASFAQKMNEAKESGLFNRFQFKYQVIKSDNKFNSFVFQKTQLGINVEESAVIEDYSKKEQYTIDYRSLFAAEGLHRTNPDTGTEIIGQTSDSLPNALAEQILLKIENYSKRFAGHEMFANSEALKEREEFKHWIANKYYAEINEGYVESFLDATVSSPMFRATSFERIFNKIFPTERTCTTDAGIESSENPGLLNIPDIREKIEDKLEEILCREFYNPTRQRTPVKVDKVANKLVTPPGSDSGTIEDLKASSKKYMGSSLDNEPPPERLRPIEEAALDGLIMTRIRLGIIQKVFEYLVMMPVFEMKAMLKSEFFMEYLYNFLLSEIDKEVAENDYRGNYRSDIFTRCQKIMKDRLGGGHGQTSYVDEHYHVYEIDEEGYGIAKSSHGHIHQVVDYQVLPSQELSLEALIQNNLVDLGDLPPGKSRHHVHTLQSAHRVPGGYEAFKTLVGEEFINVFDIFDEVLQSSELSDLSIEKIFNASGIFKRLLKIGDIYEIPASGDAYVEGPGGAIPIHGNSVEKTNVYCAYAADQNGGGKFHNIPAMWDNKLYDNFIFEPYIAIEHELEEDGQPKLKTYLKQLSDKIANYEAEGYESTIDDYQDLFNAKGININNWYENGIWSIEHVNQLFGIIAGAESILEFAAAAQADSGVGLTKENFNELLEYKGKMDLWDGKYKHPDEGSWYTFEELDKVGTEDGFIKGGYVEASLWLSTDAILDSAWQGLEQTWNQKKSIWEQHDSQEKFYCTPHPISGKTPAEYLMISCEMLKQNTADAWEAKEEAKADWDQAYHDYEVYVHKRQTAARVLADWEDYLTNNMSLENMEVSLADEQMLSVKVKDLFKCFSYGLRVSYVSPAEAVTPEEDLAASNGHVDPYISGKISAIATPYYQFNHETENLSDFIPTFYDGDLSFRTKAYAQKQFDNDIYADSADGTLNSKEFFTLPLVDYEIPVWQFLKCKHFDIGGNENLRVIHLLNDSLSETFYGSPGNIKNTARDIMYKRLFASREFKLVFDHIFPFNRTLSMMALYIDAVGRETDMATSFSDTKAVIRNIINSLLHADAAFLPIARGIQNSGGFEAIAMKNQPGTTIAMPDMSDIYKSLLQQHPKLILKGLVELTDPCVKQALLILQGVQFLGNTGMDIAKRGFKTDKALTNRKLNKAKDRRLQIDNEVFNYKQEIAALESAKSAAENEEDAAKIVAIEAQIKDILFKLYGSDDPTFQTGEPYTEETAPVGAFGGLLGEKAYINWKAEDNEGQVLTDIPITPLPNYPKPLYAPWPTGYEEEANIERLENKIANINEEIMNIEQEQIDLMDMGTPDKLPLTCVALRPSMTPYGFGFPPPLGTGPPLTMYGTIYLAMVAAGLYDNRDRKAASDAEEMRNNNSSAKNDDEAC